MAWTLDCIWYARRVAGKNRRRHFSNGQQTEENNDNWASLHWNSMCGAHTRVHHTNPSGIGPPLYHIIRSYHEFTPFSPFYILLSIRFNRNCTMPPLNRIATESTMPFFKIRRFFISFKINKKNTLCALCSEWWRQCWLRSIVEMETRKMIKWNKRQYFVLFLFTANVGSAKFHYFIWYQVYGRLCSGKRQIPSLVISFTGCVLCCISREP